MTYLNELTAAMTWLGSQPDTIFIGQQVRYPGNALFKTLEGVPMEKRIELPVAEDMQMGMSIGLAMMGKVVISIYPRMDFLLLAMNQLVLHLDKNLYPLKGKVIIRTCIGSTTPMNPGAQHCGDYTEGLDKLLRHTRIYNIFTPSEIIDVYKCAYLGKESGIIPPYTNLKDKWLIIERADNYGMES